MFYSSELLSKRDSGFGLLWLAATLGSKSTLKKLSKKSVMTADISLLCEQIGQPAEPLALRLSSNLMVGVARVYKLKHEIFVTDVTTVYTTLKTSVLAAKGAHVVDPKSLQMKKSTAAFDKITMTVDHGGFLDLDFDIVGLDWDAQMTDTDSILDHSRRSKSLEANRSLHTIDESHLQSSSLDDAFDPFNYFDIGTGAGESSAHIDLGLELGLEWDAALQPAAAEGEFEMEGVDIDPGPEFDMPDYQPMEDAMDFALDPQAGAEEEVGAGSQGRRSRSVSTTKRDRSEDQEDDLGYGGTPRSILRTRPLSEVGNLLPEGNSIQEGDFILPEADPNALEESINLSIDNEDRAPTPKPKRVKKQVRILVDARTELTDKELKDARDNYLAEQNRLRMAIEEQRFNKEATAKAHDLLRAPPAMFQVEPLREMWAATFLVQIETKTGAIKLVDAGPRKRAKKRRRVGESDAGVEAGGGQQEQNEDFLLMGNDGGFMDAGDENFLGGDDYAAMNAEDEQLPFDLDQSRIRSSEEPEQARWAPSRAPSVHSIDMLRRQEADVGSQHSGLLPWDNAAPSSSLNEAFAGSLGGGWSDRKSIQPDIADTNVELRSLSGSRRGSVASSQRGPGSPAIPASLADAPLDDFQLSIGEDQVEQNFATQTSEAALQALERNSLNFLAFAKMQQHAQTRPLTLDDLVSSVKTPHGAANAFYCCLVLATKRLVKLTQTEPFGTITLELIG